MRLAGRLSRVEQAAQTKLQGLLTPKAKLEKRAAWIRRLGEYLGLPTSDDYGLAGLIGTDERAARRALATGLEHREAHLMDYAERRGITTDEAHEWMARGRDAIMSVARDIAAGVPAESSARAAELREWLTVGPVEGLRGKGGKANGQG
jgi:hypothetical protein